MLLFLKLQLTLPFLCHKSATTCQIDSNKASNSKLKPDLCNCVKTENIESKTPPQQPYKGGAIFLGHPVDNGKQSVLRGEKAQSGTINAYVTLMESKLVLHCAIQFGNLMTLLIF